MLTLSFTDGNDNYTVSGPGDYDLSFLRGDDILSVNGGTSTTANMGSGDDLVRLIVGAASVYGGNGLDRFEVWAPDVSGFGGADNDTLNIRGGSGQTLNGDSGDDRFNIFVDTSGLILRGGDGNDTFYGYRHTIGGNVNGGAGNDFFVDFIATTLVGSLGNDIYRIHPTGTPTIVEKLDQGTDAVQISRGFSYTLANNVENLAVGSYSGSTTGAATLTGNSLDNSMIGWSNNETMWGLGGNDKLIGKGGDDTLHGGDGNDLLDGGDGTDWLYGDDGNDTLQGRAGNDIMVGGAGDDIYYVDSFSDGVSEAADGGTDWVRASSNFTLPSNVENGQVWTALGASLFGNTMDNLLVGGAGNDNLWSVQGNDTVKGGGGDDYIVGGEGNDILYGNAGDDDIYCHADDDIAFGGDGADYLYGDSGNDILYGGAGADALRGVGGNDTFAFVSASDSTPGASDVIEDMHSSSGAGADDDLIDLTAIDANTALDGDQAFTFSADTPAANCLWVTSITTDGANKVYVLSGDVNGDASADFQLTVTVWGTTLYLDDVLF